MKNVRPLKPNYLCKLAKTLFPEGPTIQKLMQHWRPAIAPFHEILPEVPTGASVLDVGCGGGLLLMLLAAERHISLGVGFDASARAISFAKHAANQNGFSLRFETRKAGDGWPEGLYDVVSIVDVLHHIPRPDQKAVLQQAVKRLLPGGKLILKDMTERPRWRVCASKLHDLVLAKQWIEIPRRQDILSFTHELGLELNHEKTTNMLWYGHQLYLFHKPTL